MFSYEEYYKLYNVPADAKYQEMVRYLKNHVAEMNGNGSKNFRDRMLQYSKTQAEYLLLLARIEELWHEDYLRSASKAELTHRPLATMVTSLPSLKTTPLPISNL